MGFLRVKSMTSLRASANSSQFSFDISQEFPKRVSFIKEIDKEVKIWSKLKCPYKAFTITVSFAKYIIEHSIRFFDLLRISF